MTDKLQAVREALQEIHDNVFNWERRSIRDIAAKALSELSANTEAQPSGSSAVSEREAFEAMVRANYPQAPLDRHPDDNQKYDGLLATRTWTAWQARASLSAPAQENARDVAQYRWLIECARKTGITIHFQGDALVIGHGYSKEQNERDILDAERYRWLRSMIFDDSIIIACEQMLHGPKLDEAVDAAIAKEAGK